MSPHRRRLLLVLLPITLSLAPWAATATEAPTDSDARAGERAALWNQVAAQLDYLSGNLGFERFSPRLQAALLEVPRHAFVPPEQSARAYQNRPLPIGQGQTISQPLIVAVMTELLQVEPGDKVFELGTGSGYQAAVLEAMGAEVYSVEIVPELGKSARRALDDNGYERVRSRIGDGYFGWPDAGPFDAIIVTAAGDHIPPPLLRQLKPGGRMVLPVGSRYQTQQLVLATRDQEGRIRTRELMAVAFVPLTGGH